MANQQFSRSRSLSFNCAFGNNSFTLTEKGLRLNGCSDSEKLNLYNFSSSKSRSFLGRVVFLTLGKESICALDWVLIESFEGVAIYEMSILMSESSFREGFLTK
jgi:hypothetical protein